MIAVLLQYELPSGFLHGLVPTALTIDATHDGPPVLRTSQLWSLSNESGITQETPRSLQAGAAMSDKTFDGANSRWEVNSLPAHFPLTAPQMWAIELGAIQVPVGLESFQVPET